MYSFIPFRFRKGMTMQYVWIGGFATSSHWEWRGTNDEFQFDNWYTIYNPPVVGKCVAMAGNHGQWISSYCSTPRYSVCEYP